MRGAGSGEGEDGGGEGHVVAIFSPKGGVGRTTVAVNLAIAIAAQGAKVALIDSDFYGPSIPTLLGGGEGGQRGFDAFEHGWVSGFNSL